MLYLKRPQEKRKKSGKKILYRKSNGQKDLHYFMLQIMYKKAQKVQYFLDLAAICH